MNSGSRDGWPSGQNPPSTGGPPQNNEPSSNQASRPLGRFDGSSGPSHQGQQKVTQGTGPVLPPPSASYHPGVHGGHNLPSLSGLAQASQASPHASHRAPAGPDSAPGGPPHQAGVPGGGYALPGLNQTLHAQHHGQPQPGPERRLEARDGHEIDRHLVEEAAEREMMGRVERMQQEQTSQENHGGQIQIHQPVAVAPQARGIHGPNGLLGNASAITGASSLPGAVSASHNVSAMFGPAQPPQGETTPRMQHAVQPPPQHLMVPFAPGAAAQQQQQQLNMGQGQGQQPILNDALSYLDQVKIQFGDHPDVYNRFLDIMKDFKSGAIDTPGVIDRVSTLFAGNPALIQGFNTFLPPGYRIECGLDNDPNSIRVTTPQGTTVSSLAGSRPLSAPRSTANGITSAPADRPMYDSMAREASNWSQNAPATSDMFSPGRTGQAGYTGPQAHQPSFSPEAQRSHPDTTGRGVSQLQNAAAVADAGVPKQHIMSPSGGAPAQLAGQAMNGVSAPGSGEKRGPVEFNHAISYVNKIKNRFAQQPDIYKQFLEILQTYQRESKPIQDVYAQVTTLFGGAPDLLDDFKQFLPETTGQQRTQQARQQAEDAPTSNMRGETTYPPQSQLQHTPRADSTRLPPLGNFPTPTPGKDSHKRKRNDRQGTAVGSANPNAGVDTANSNRSGHQQGVKRPKQGHHTTNKSLVADGPAVSPTLTPALPSPLPPLATTSSTPDELAFFDRAKKVIANKGNMNEFLKLCNMFSQDLISSDAIVARANSFIGGNPELYQWFKNFMGYEPKSEVYEAKVSNTFDSKVSLSNCRGLGPSYRLLPRTDRARVCSGRDDLCRSVLNDEWASHPTWASEDSGFIAHRKNQHEEGLHRIEEERHDYDFNIEACVHTIQQLEPIAQQLHMMSPQSRANFVLPPGLGGQSEAIYKRVILKVYGREKGLGVVQSLFEQPYKVVPVVLGRLKNKLEEWKAAQREWAKVWREQTQRIFWKSLDHQSIGAKQADKRQFQTKTLQTEIQVKYEEQKRQQEVQGLTVSNYQFAYSFEDIDVLYDAARLVLVTVDHSSANEPRLHNFLKDFIPLFFGLDAAKFEERIRISPNSSPRHDDVEDENSSPDDTSSRSARGKGKNNLLRDVLERGRTTTRAREDTSAPASRATTPEVTSNADDEMTAEDGSASGDATTGRPTSKWMEHPQAGNDSDLDPELPYTRDVYNMYVNLPIYCFFRMLVILYERLLNLKRNEDEVRDIVKKALSSKPALDFSLIDKQPGDFFSDVSDSANYYQQVLGMIDELLKGGEMEIAHIEETLRRFYLQTGWQLYSIDKLLSSLSRFALAVMTSEAKDKTWDIYQLFKKNRQCHKTTRSDELNYRRQVEKYVKDGDVYRIQFRQNEMRAYVKLFKKEEQTFDTRYFSPEEKWRCYISTYTNLEPTEGMQQQPLAKVYLSRHVEQADEASDDGQSRRVTTSKDQMEIRVGVQNFRLCFKANTEEYLVKSALERTGGDAGLREMEEQRERLGETARVKLLVNNTWMKGLSKDQVDLIKTEWESVTRDVPTVKPIEAKTAGVATGPLKPGEDSTAEGADVDTSMTEV